MQLTRPVQIAASQLIRSVVRTVGGSRAPVREMADLIAEVKRLHFPMAPATSAEIARAEASLGCPFPEDLRQFYAACGGALLFAPEAAPYEIVEPELVRPVRRDILGADDENVPASWLSLCYLQDGNYVGIDLPPQVPGEVWLIDCFHETLGIEDCNGIIALSFREFLERALGSEGRHYWLTEDLAYGDALERRSG